MAVDAFGLDLALSPNFAIGVLYALVVVLGLWWSDRSYIITSAIAVSVLCLLGFYFSFSGDLVWMEVANRGFALIVIWLVAVLCFFHKTEKIEKLELLRQNDRIGQEQFKVENDLKESREKLQDMEKDTALGRLKILEKEAQLDQVEQTLKEQESKIAALAEGQSKGEEAFERLRESLDRLQEEKIKNVERLMDKDARIKKSEADRDRTADALWEKEQRLADVLDDLSLLENDLRDKAESSDRAKKLLAEKDRVLEQLEHKMLSVENQSRQAQKTVEDREGLLEKIKNLIHESLIRKRKPPVPKKITRDAPGFEYEPVPREQNGKNPLPEKELNDEKVKNRFRRYTQELERSNEDLREFASIASHDLKEPIRKIIGFGMRLKKDCYPMLDDKGKDYLERMERSAQKMQKFVDDLLQYSKVTASSTSRHFVDLNDVLSQVLADFETRIEETHAQIEVGSLPAIESDRMQMAQLFQNLISNALKFHKKGEPPVVRINHRLLENGFHEIRVQDQGIGFDEKHRDRIFKPFERLHGKSEYEGTGMGLAICQKIAHRHGGKLTAQSSPQEGSTFIVTLPSLRDEEKRG